MQFSADLRRRCLHGASPEGENLHPGQRAPPGSTSLRRDARCRRCHWTASAPLPGGDFPVDGVDALKDALVGDFPFLDQAFAQRLVRAYGTQAPDVVGTARSMADLGRSFGWNLTEREVKWLIEKEWARSAEDVVWRRSKVGLRLTKEQISALDDWIAAKRGAKGEIRASG